MQKISTTVLFFITLLLTSLADNPVSGQCAQLTTPTLGVVADRCRTGADLACPADGSGICVDNGDTLRVATTFTNLCADAAFRVVFRVEGPAGTDLLFGGPSCMTGSCAATSGWDDSFGMVHNTPQVGSGVTWTTNTTFSLVDRQLEKVLGLSSTGNQTADLTVRVEIFDRNFTTLYDTAVAPLRVERHRNSLCDAPVRDGETVFLHTNLPDFEDADPVVFEVGAMGATASGVPAWTVPNSPIFIDVIEIEGAGSSDPEAACDAACGTSCAALDVSGDFAGQCLALKMTLSSAAMTQRSAPACPCTTTDEHTGIDYSYAVDPQGTFSATVSASNFADDRVFLVRTRGVASTNGSHPARSPQHSWFTRGTLASSPVTLASFHAFDEGDHLRVEWSTALEVGNVGFRLLAETADGPVELTKTLVPGHLDSTRPRDYEWEGPHLDGAGLFLVDVDYRGRERRHGPFEIGAAFGERSREMPIDWAKIRDEHLEKSSRRAVLKNADDWELLVDRDGLYRVTHEELVLAGLDLSGTPAIEIALLRAGEPVALRLGGREVFGPGSFLEFEGRAAESVYTRTMPYRLTLDPASARRVAEVMSIPAGGAIFSDGFESGDLSAWGPASPPAAASWYEETAWVEKDLEYSFLAPNGDPWYEAWILAYTNPKSKTVTINVDDLDTEALASGAPAELRVELWGLTDWPESPDHHVRIEFNGSPVAETIFDGLRTRMLKVALQPQQLREGANSLKIILPGDTGVDWDMVVIDAYGVTYPRRFRARSGVLRFAASGERFEVEGLGEDASIWRLDDGVPTVLIGKATGTGVSFSGTEVATTHLVTDVGSLLHPVLRPASPSVDLLSGSADYLVVSHPDFLADLEPLIAAREAEGRGVRVVDLDEIFRNYSHGVIDPEAIRAYLRDAVPALGVEMVLLVGGDSYDPLDHLGLGGLSFVPAPYAATGLVVHHAPLDPLLVDLDGDDLPDLPIGRLPARSSAELHSMIDKTLNYATAGHAFTAVLASDRDGDGTPFTADRDAFAAALPSHWSITTAGITDQGLATARATLRAELDEGRALVGFFGHSSMTKWSSEDLFSASTANVLANAGRPSVVVQWGCWNTWFVDPYGDTLAHRLLLGGDRGAAAVLGATTLTTAAAESLLAQRFATALVAAPGRGIGEVLHEAKMDLAATHPHLREVLLGWTLLGDPALVVEP